MKQNRLSHRAVSCLWLLLFSCLPMEALGAPTTDVFRYPVTVGKETSGLRQIQSHLATIDALRALFSQTKNIAVLSRPLISEGSFLFARGKGALWSMQKPYESLFIVTPDFVKQSDAIGQLSYVKASEQPVLKNFTKVFLGLLTGNLSALSEQFEIFFFGDASSWRIGLKGKDSRLAMFLDYITLAGAEVVNEVHIVEKTGDSTLIQFKEVETNNVQLTSDEMSLLAG